MALLLIVIVLVLIFGGGGGFYYGNRQFGSPVYGGGFGLGTVLLILLVLYLLGGLHHLG